MRLDQVRAEQLRAAVQAVLSSNSWAQSAADHAEGSALLHDTTAVLLTLLYRNNNDNPPAPNMVPVAAPAPEPAQQPTSKRRPV